LAALFFQSPHGPSVEIRAALPLRGVKHAVVRNARVHNRADGMSSFDLPYGDYIRYPSTKAHEGVLFDQSCEGSSGVRTAAFALLGTVPHVPAEMAGRAGILQRIASALS